ncbi:MAG TPA: hypothetical protein VMX55_09480 [candidate division Zixibacteria bacterium]|nr:hypothetical protein [candidate division Zixibacteria bacterium]
MTEEKFDQIIEKLDFRNKLLAIQIIGGFEQMRIKEFIKLFKSLGFSKEELELMIASRFGKAGARKLIFEDRFSFS